MRSCSGSFSCRSEARWRSRRLILCGAQLGPASPLSERVAPPMVRQIRFSTPPAAPRSLVNRPADNPRQSRPLRSPDPASLACPPRRRPPTQLAALSVARAPPPPILPWWCGSTERGGNQGRANLGSPRRRNWRLTGSVRHALEARMGIEGDRHAPKAPATKTRAAMCRTETDQRQRRQAAIAGRGLKHRRHGFEKISADPAV